MKVLISRYLVIISVLLLFNDLAVHCSELMANSVPIQHLGNPSIEETKEIVDIFLNNPTEENFKLIKSYIFPVLEENKREVPAWTEWVEQLITHCVERKEAYWIMEYEIFSDNQYMALFARKLLEVSDGLGASVLLTIFGKLTRMNPKLFLSIFKKDIRNPFVELALTKPIFFTGTELYEKYERFDLIKRIEKLRSITDPELKSIRDYCISILERELH